MTSTLKNLLEIRRRTLSTLFFFGGLFLLFFIGANPLFLLLVHPIQVVLSANSPLIATQMTSTVFIPLEVAMHAAVLCTIPFAIMQIWRFAAPGLYQHEKSLFIRLSIGSLALFLCGLTFCYMVVLPFMFKFFVSSAPNGISFMPDITSATAFITRMLWLFGLAFQLPLICIFLVKRGIITRDQLKQIRSYIIVAAFIVGMLLTPPDVFSQLMLAIPLCILYEIGIICSK